MSSRQRRRRPAVRQRLFLLPFSFFSAFIARQCALLFFFLFLLTLPPLPSAAARASQRLLRSSLSPAWAQRHADSFDSSPFAARAEGLRVTLKPQLLKNFKIGKLQKIASKCDLMTRQLLCFNIQSLHLFPDHFSFCTFPPLPPAPRRFILTSRDAALSGNLGKAWR